jgi:flagellar protein FlaF
MAVGEIIGAAIGILMLIIVAYLVVGSTLSTGELVVNTQKDVTLQNEARLRTDFSIVSATLDRQNGNVTVQIYNNGKETISDYTHMDIYFNNSTNPPILRTYGSGAGTWTTLYDPDPANDVIHPMMCDPGETMWISAQYDAGSATDLPERLSVTTANGVYASSSVSGLI